MSEPNAGHPKSVSLERLMASSDSGLTSLALTTGT
jgi:hypothetical protein